MKRLLLAGLILILIAASVWAQAPDRRISDADSHIVDVTAIGSILTVGGGIESGHKTVTTAGTAVSLGASIAIHKVIITPLKGNSAKGLNKIFVGDSSVDSSNGYEMITGEIIEVNVDTLSDIMIDAEQNGDGVSYLAITEE